MDKRRKPNPAERRRDLCDAAIQLLADDGAKGLSHLKVDRKAGVPDGTTSFYFRTRSALLRAVAERSAELDLAEAAGRRGQFRWPAATLAVALSQVVIQAGSEPQLYRTRARYELTMQATRDPALAAILQQATDEFTKLHREILVQLMPHGAELDSGRRRGSEQRHADVHQWPAAAVRPRRPDHRQSRTTRRDPVGDRVRDPEEFGQGPAHPDRRPSRVAPRGGRVRVRAPAGHGSGSGSCQGTRCMVLYENRVGPCSCAVFSGACAHIRATQLSGVYKLPQPNPALQRWQR